MQREVSYVPEILAYLSDYRLKQTGPDRYTCNSPLRSGSDSGAFALAVDPAYGGGGKWYDFVAAEGGNFVDLARRLGLIPDAAVAVPTTKRSYTDLADYARAHGVDPDVFRAAHWRSGAWFDPQAGRKRPALLFETAGGTRARFIDGASPTYRHKAGFQRCWYGLKRAQELDGPLVFCNGEASAVVAASFGVPAVTIAGGGEKPIPPGLLQELAATVPPGSREIVIALDADTAGRRSARQIVAQLREACYTARAVAFDGHPGFDLADFCRLHQAGALAALRALPDLPDEAPQSPAGPTGEIVATLRAVNERLDKALRETQERLRWLTDLFARKDLKMGARAAVRGIVLEMERVPVEERTDGRLYEVRAWKIAEENGTTTSTISRALDRLSEIGYIEKHKTTSYDPEEQRTRTTIYVRPLVNLRALEEVPPLPKAPTVKPRCMTCGSPQLSAVEYVCENGHITDAEAARTIAAQVAQAEQEACLHSANTVPAGSSQGELRPESGGMSPDDPFFAERACEAPVLRNEDLNPSPLTSNDPSLQNANTPAPVQEAPGHLPSIGEVIERLWQRKAGLEGAAPAT